MKKKLDPATPWQGLVREFHVACSMPAPDKFQTLDTARTLLRESLIIEEAREVSRALLGLDASQADVIKELCDLIYVCLGTAVEMGIDLDPYFRAVHESNMAKAGGPRRSDGKQMKPDGWQPPPIAEMLAGEQLELFDDGPKFV